MLVVDVRNERGGEDANAEELLCEVLGRCGIQCEVVKKNSGDKHLAVQIQVRQERQVNGTQEGNDVVERLRAEVAAKEREVQEMEGSLNTAMESIKEFHKQQNDLFEEFVSLREKYDNHKMKLRKILWEYLPENVIGFENIPKVQVEIEETEDSVGGWKFGAILGEGQFAVVKEVREGDACTSKRRVGNKNFPAKDGKDAPSFLAVKRILKDKISDIKNTLRINNEVRILRDLDHPNIVKLIDVVHTSNYLYLIQERGGLDLFEYYRKNPGPSKEQFARSIVAQLASATAYLQHHGLVHRDLKPENVLLGPGMQVKLVDFGLSTEYRSGLGLDDFCGTPGFFAPEMLLRKQYECDKLDAWSLGCVLLEILLGHVSFAEVWMPAYAYEHLHDPAQFERELHKCLAAVQVIFAPDRQKLLLGSGLDESLMFKNHANRDSCIKAFRQQQARSPECCDMVLSLLSKSPEHRNDCQGAASHRFVEGELRTSGKLSRADSQDSIASTRSFPGHGTDMPIHKPLTPPPKNLQNRRAKGGALSIVTLADQDTNHPSMDCSGTHSAPSAQHLSQHGAERGRLPPLSPSSPKVEGVQEIVRIGDALLTNSLHSFKS